MEPVHQGGYALGTDGPAHAGHCSMIGYVEQGQWRAQWRHESSTVPGHRRTAPRLAELGPIAQLRAGRLGRRLPQLFIGLFLYGVSLAMMVRGVLGLAPWDVLHSGFVRHVPMTLGQAVVLFSFVVLVLWIPLREMPGLGTISNAVVVGLSADATLAVLAGRTRSGRASP